jgi:hypothetical protein
MKKSKSLTQVSEDIELYQNILREYRDLRDELELQQELPGLKKKYVGTYWKFKNSYGSRGESWWLYSYCKDVLSGSMGVFNTFETTPNGSNLNVGTESGLHLCENAIGRDEYLLAFEAFIKMAKQLKG